MGGFKFFLKTFYVSIRMLTAAMVFGLIVKSVFFGRLTWLIIPFLIIWLTVAEEMARKRSDYLG